MGGIVSTEAASIVTLFSFMADECSDVITQGSWQFVVPEEHFIQIVPLKKANAESMYSALVGVLQGKKYWVGKAYRNGIGWSCYFL